jgi:uncharacterized membrane protein
MLQAIKTGSRLLMAVFYIAAGVNHFRAPEFYTAMMPPYMDLHLQWVYLSGVAEIALGGLLAVPRTARLAAWGIIAMLLAFLPVHVHMLVNNHLFPAVPTSLLWLRFPMQAVLILWAWIYTLPPRERAAPATQAPATADG